MQKIKWVTLVLVLVLTWSCTKIPQASLYTPVSSDATANATLEQLLQGRDLYINNCGSCHNLYSPDDFSASSWKSIMPSMAPKTGMNASQVSLVSKYVTRGQ
jgi:mono/diheme cytochrome c family protein